MSELTPTLLTPVSRSPSDSNSPSSRRSVAGRLRIRTSAGSFATTFPSGCSAAPAGSGAIWLPDGQLVGVGTIDARDHYIAYTHGRIHPYIPLLAVNPVMEGRGYGKLIVRHLIDQAAILACGPGGYHDVLFLDVYTTTRKPSDYTASAVL